MTEWRQKAKSSLRSILFLRFAVLPLIILFLMNKVFDVQVADIGGLTERSVTIGQIYERPAPPGAAEVRPPS